MNTNISRGVSIGRSVAREVRERDVTLLAASLAYYAFVSVVPLLVVAVVVAAALGGEALRTEVMELADAYLLPTAAEEIRTVVRNSAGGGGVGLVGGAVALWGALKLFRGLDAAFSRVYGSETDDLLGQMRDGVIALGAVGAGVVGVSAVTAVIGLLPLPLLQWISPLILLATLTVAFFPLYYVFPDVPMEPREALPGTVLAAVGWTVLGSAFGFYAAATAKGDAAIYGLLGAILLLVTWFYFGGMVILIGAVVNAVLAGRMVPTPGRRRPAAVGAGLGAAAGGHDAEAHGGDRQLQQGRVSGTERMSTDEPDSVAGAADERGEPEPAGAPDIAALDDRVDELRADLDSFETDVSQRTVERSELEDDLKKYVRQRVRRGHARGWGPYLVLLYGTAMTLGAFYFLESDWAAVLAMIILFLSTLGLYVLFLLVGIGLNVAGTPGQLVRKVRDIRR